MAELSSQVVEMLAEKLGTTTAYAWDVLLKQSNIEKIKYFSIMLVLFVVILGGFFGLRYLTYRWYESNDDELILIGWVVYGVLSLIMGVFITGCGSELITLWLNPEYWALTQLLS
jgi:hypothetical protein